MRTSGEAVITVARARGATLLLLTGFKEKKLPSASSSISFILYCKVETGRGATELCTGVRTSDDVKADIVGTTDRLGSKGEITVRTGAGDCVGMLLLLVSVSDVRVTRAVGIGNGFDPL